MISIAYQDLLLTVIALAMVAIAVTAAWFARRTRRTLDRYEQLATAYERLGLRGEQLLAQLELVAGELRGAAGHAAAMGRNGADGVDAALGLVRQLSAVGSGIKTAVETFQQSKSSFRN